MTSGSSMQDRASQMEAFITAMAAFEELDTPEATILAMIERIRPHIRGPEGAETSASLEYWVTVFNAVCASTTREQIKDVARQYYLVSNEHALPRFNVSQGLMKATSHLIWRKLYALEAGKLRSDAREAIRDAMVPPHERGAQFLRAIMEEIAAEHGETLDEMTERLDPE